jgi:hypothetical protein
VTVGSSSGLQVIVSPSESDKCAGRLDRMIFAKHFAKQLKLNITSSPQKLAKLQFKPRERNHRFNWAGFLNSVFLDRVGASALEL